MMSVFIMIAYMKEVITAIWCSDRHEDTEHPEFPPLLLASPYPRHRLKVLSGVRSVGHRILPADDLKVWVPD